MNMTHHDSLAVASEGIFQELGQDRVSVGNPDPLLALAVLGQGVDHVSQRGQAQVDGSAFLQPVTGGSGRLNTFTEQESLSV